MEDINFVNDTDHIKNMVGDLDNISKITKIDFKYNEGYLYGGRRRNKGTHCTMTLDNGYEVSYFSEAGFGQSKEDSEIKCLQQLGKIDDYLEYCKGVNNESRS